MNSWIFNLKFQILDVMTANQSTIFMMLTMNLIYAAIVTKNYAIVVI